MPLHPEKLTVTDGTALTAEQLPALTAEGYTFGGWYDGETKAEAGYKVTKDVTLTAKWTKNTVTPTPDDGEDDGGNTTEVTKYTVTFSTNGGTEITSQKIESGKTATEPTAPTKDGYTFGGWFTDSNFTTAFTFSTAITADITLYAKWIEASKPTYTVTFSTDGAETKQNVAEGEKAVKPADPTKEGYTFAGWFNGESAFDFETAITANITLTAKWTASGTSGSDPQNPDTPTAPDDSGNTGDTTTYTVTFTTNGGTEVASQKIESGKTATEPTAPTKDGYAFAGWFTDSGLTAAFTFNTAITADITLYAKWIEAAKTTFTVTFSVDGAETKQTVAEGEKAVKPADPTKTGYTFDGWYKDDTKFDFETTVTVNLTLTAKWTLITYTITYEGLNGVENPNTITSYTVESETITLQNPTRTGYTFVWMNGSDEVTQITKGSTGNITLTGKWTAISYEITYVLPNGVTNPNVTSYTIETDTITLQSPARTGYTFNGWYNAETGGNKVESIVQGSTGAKTFYAQWWTFSLQVSGTPSKTLYYVGDSLDTTGLTVTATYSDGSSKTLSGFYTENVNLGSKLTISYTEGGLTKTADVSGTFYVAASGAKPTESPVKLSYSDYTGTLAGGTYYAFGDFPQTIAAGTVTFSDVPVYNGWYLGSDGYFYAKCTENAYDNSYTYSDGTTVAQAGANSTKYFKVEPIKWRVLNPSASGNKILVAESILTANVAYYDYCDVNRTIGGKTVYPNNYEHSKIRAYLNGLSYEVKETDPAEQTTDSTYNEKGFLQTAFTSSAQSLIATTTVDNSAASTNPASNASQWNSGTNDYVCENTSDKIFLLSEKEATTSDYGFPEYNVQEKGNSRVRVTTDYAKANYTYQSPTAGYGGWWWLRSPRYSLSNYAHYIYGDGKADNFHPVSNGRGVVPALSISTGN